MQTYQQQLIQVLQGLKVLEGLVCESLPYNEQTFMIAYIESILVEIKKHQEVIQNMM